MALLSSELVSKNYQKNCIRKCKGHEGPHLTLGQAILYILFVPYSIFSLYFTHSFNIITSITIVLLTTFSINHPLLQIIHHSIVGSHHVLLKITFQLNVIPYHINNMTHLCHWSKFLLFMGNRFKIKNGVSSHGWIYIESSGYEFRVGHRFGFVK